MSGVDAAGPETMAVPQEGRMSLYIWNYAEFQLIQDEPSPLIYKWTVLAVKSCRLVAAGLGVGERDGVYRLRDVLCALQ